MSAETIPAFECTMPLDLESTAAVRVGFSRRRRWNPVSALISWLADSPVTHAWLLVEVMGEPIVWEATDWTFHATHLEEFKKANEVVAVISPRHPIDAGFRIMLHDLDRPFDVLGLIGMVVVVLGRKLRRKWTNPVHGDKALFCSELVCRVCKLTDYPNFLLDPDGVTPGDLLRFFLEERFEPKK